MHELHSYRFSVQRVVAAVVTHDPDPPRPPLRRGGVSALAGLLVAAVALGAAAAYGLFTGHSRTEATDPGAILLERRTGTRYVYLPSDGRLHPVLNYTSGLLLTSGDTPELRTIGAAKLASVPLGEPLGIPGAPDALPAAGDLLTGPWSLCTAAGTSTLLVGAAPSGGLPLTGGLLVRAAGRTQMVFEGRSYALTDNEQKIAAWSVPEAWLGAIPAAPGHPAGISPPSDAPASACVTLASDQTQAGVRVNATFPSGAVHVPRGKGALVSADGDKIHLVTDSGQRFELAGADLLGKLGYAGVTPLRVPERFLAQLPAGPALDPVRAGRA
ncbi:hypothetical protein FB565_004419 [Actinoplanes lutulentus]|uniref:Type VII secretion system ESX-1 transmembrane protein B n=1 Tax=Actinoplanes lutulentus TaxID=1287878 RepID=A0A327ZBS9_9ACTN|nr:type VII secretion protein EccB [Actinoplanes lutulentus]MBB2944686.1 hypothetical protein [Actinoplanes lutulentus]RAK35519.1 type VII secretion system ESX-1 transmembrane protein B [Actinoplanes lutulentus]